MDEDLPAQPAKGATSRRYWHVKLVYILGFLEVLFGGAIIVVEIGAICFFYDEKLSQPLEIIGIFVGLYVAVIGCVGFIAGQNNVIPETRHKLFISGTVLTLLGFAIVAAMLVVSGLRTHFLYLDVKDKEGRTDPNGVSYQNLPYVFSLEGLRHLALLRSIAAVVYSILTLLLFASLILNIKNIGKNRQNVDSSKTSDDQESKNPFIFKRP